MKIEARIEEETLRRRNKASIWSIPKLSHCYSEILMLNYGNNIFPNLQLGDQVRYEGNTDNYVKVHNYHIQKYNCQEKSFPLKKYQVTQLRLLADKRRYQSEQRTIIQRKYEKILFEKCELWIRSNLRFCALEN